MSAPMRRAWAVLRGLPWSRFAVGVLAGGAALALSLLLRSLGIGVFLPELATDFVVGRIPGGVESFFIRTMGEGAKVLGLVTAVVVFLALSGIYAVFFRRVQGRLKDRWAVIAAYALGYAGAALFLILPLLGGGLLGTATAQGPFAASFSQIVAGWIFAALLDYAFVDLPARHPEGQGLTRRQFLTMTALALGGIALAVYGFGALVARTGRLVFASVDEMLRKEVTPTEEFYIVSKNVIDPDVDANSWRLTISGLVASPKEYTYDELLAAATTGEFVTLECVSNEVGGNLISTARWEGLRLRDLLEATGIGPEADWVEFSSADGYIAGVPLAKALQDASLLALRMNGDPLPKAHGFPARILVPGLYGMFHAKWVTEIRLVQGEVVGFWQQKGWTNRGAIRTTTIIATPRPDSVVGSVVAIGGVAFAGDRRISRVEVSADGGATWAEAALKSSPLSGTTWTLWTYEWRPSASGSHRILARAVDGTGEAQEATPSPPFPNGSAGYDSITLLVSL